MRTFEYAKATNVAEAVELVTSRPGAVFLAGGTNLVDLMKLGVARPDALVDLTALPLSGIDHRDDGSSHVGATVRNSELAGDSGIRTRFPVLSQAVLAGASGQLRSVATTGGNLLQRTRCVYFQDVTKPCNKREPGTGCSAIDGLHRDLAVLGTSSACVATHPSDMAVALAALDATVHVRRRDGSPQRVRLDEFYRLPEQTPHRETILTAGDLVTGVDLPALPADTVSAYRKVRDRASYAFAVVSVAAVVRIEDEVVRDVRVALGGVAPRPWRAQRFEDALSGRRPDRELIRAAARDEMAEATPLPGNAFKVDLAVDVMTSVVSELTGGEWA
ncbi:FAD binding domain-containing protein [Pseudonocardia xinjiangensis]|uniref:FAD binding domain-containing protein n=1 Tax=Pseudonocardia xinjiangensis TaxID=75289 RepID=UPI003D8C1A0A